MVPKEGLEPSSQLAVAFETTVFPNFTTSALIFIFKNK